jgi:hypothetical protein
LLDMVSVVDSLYVDLACLPNRGNIGKVTIL